MPSWIPRSLLGVVLAVIYIAAAVFLIREERGQSAGGWISLRGMTSYLVTFPVSAIGEWLGVRPDFRRNIDMTFAVSVCAMLFYLVGAGLGKLARMIFHAMGGS